MEKNEILENAYNVKKLKPGSIFRFGSKITNGVFGYLRRQDDYGEPIQLNYKGEQTF
jgi:hypothetical protein